MDPPQDHQSTPTTASHQYYVYNFGRVLAKGWKSGAPPLLSIQFSIDVVERMLLSHNYALISEKASLYTIARTLFGEATGFGGPAYYYPYPTNCYPPFFHPTPGTSQLRTSDPVSGFVLISAHLHVLHSPPIWER